MIEDSKRKRLLRSGRRLLQGTRVRIKKTRTGASRELFTTATRRDTRRMNVTVILRRTRRINHR